ncbi:MAG: hypothetical protein PGN08_14775 [Sphingomonas taxi]
MRCLERKAVVDLDHPPGKRIIAVERDMDVTIVGVAMASIDARLVADAEMPEEHAHRFVDLGGRRQLALSGQLSSQWSIGLGLRVAACATAIISARCPSMAVLTKLRPPIWNRRSPFVPPSFSRSI